MSQSPTQMQDISAGLVNLVASSAPSLVSVSSAQSRSSGFVWRPELIVTADEALSEDGEFTVILGNGYAAAARLVGRDPTTDIAMLRVDQTNLHPIPQKAVAVQTGALVIAMGAEDGKPTVALGVVSRSTEPWRSLRGGEIDARIELDLRLRQSAEGGPVLDAAGRFIGMAVFGPRRQIGRASWRERV